MFHILFFLIPLLAMETDLKDTKGDIIGKVTLSDSDKGVRVQVRAKRLKPGFHGIHFHQFARCEGPHFESAGAHFNPKNKKHGLKQKAGPHAGDLPNLLVNADGTVDTEFYTKEVTLALGDQSLLSHGGTSLVIHQNPDDQVSDPAGHSGNKVACAEIHDLPDGTTP